MRQRKFYQLKYWQHWNENSFVWLDSFRSDKLTNCRCSIDFRRASCRIEDRLSAAIHRHEKRHDSRISTGDLLLAVNRSMERVRSNEISSSLICWWDTFSMSSFVFRFEEVRSVFIRNSSSARLIHRSNEYCFSAKKKWRLLFTLDRSMSRLVIRHRWEIKSDSFSSNYLNNHLLKFYLTYENNLFLSLSKNSSDKVNM